MAGKCSLAIDGDRLWRRLMRLAEIGATGNGGVNRQALSDGEHAAWRLLLDWADAAGLGAWTDAAANLFLGLAGADPSLPPVLLGSHIDSQPTGGRFDGAFGVLAGLEAITVLAENNIRLARDVLVVAWLNEEGSRFAPGMMGSEAFAGQRSLDSIRAARDSAGKYAGEEIDRIHAAFPDLPHRPLGFDLYAYLEAHIEQDIVLERAQKSIGIVTGIQGKKTFEVEIAGKKGHAGTVAMAARRDAVFAFARIAARLSDEIGKHDADIKLTIGRIETFPNAPSVIADKVVFRVDMRHPDNDVLERCGARLHALCEQSAAPCTVRVTDLVSAPSNAFDPSLQNMIEAAAQRRGVPAMRMLSFAGHDAKQMAHLCPSAMIFIPCRNGISHDESEWAEPGHIGVGGQILLDTLVDLLSSSRKMGLCRKN